MSFRRSKVNIVREDCSEDGVYQSLSSSLSSKGKKVDKKKFKQKIKLKTFQEDNSDLEGLDAINIQIKKKKKNGLSIPLLDEHDIITDSAQQMGKKSLVDQFYSQKSRPVEKSSLGPKAETKHILESPKDQDYISLGLPTSYNIEEEEDQVRENEDEEDFDVEDLSMLDDGKLALTENESTLQKKLHDMGIEEALYEVDLTNDEELEDWENEKMKHGTYGSSSEVKKVKAPKLNLIAEVSPPETISEIKEILQALSVEKDELSEKLKKAIDQSDDLSRRLKLFSSKVDEL